MPFAERRSFQAAMAPKYCGGSARLAESLFGWSRHAVEPGLHERRSGVVCPGAQKACCGNILWEDRHPEAAAALWALAESHCQRDPASQATLAYTRLAAAGALRQLRGQGFAEDALPSPSERRTQFLKRTVEFADLIGKPVQLLYYPPYHSKCNPVERCWGILEKHWNGTKRADVDAMLGWAGGMTWKGIRPVVELSRKAYQKGVSLSKAAMQEVEARLERNPLLPKWDILIRPA